MFPLGWNNSVFTSYIVVNITAEKEVAGVGLNPTNTSRKEQKIEILKD